MDALNIEIVRQARAFWLNYSDGKKEYAAAVELGQVPLWVWRLGYFFSRANLDRLLPNAILPDHFRARRVCNQVCRQR